MEDGEDSSGKRRRPIVRDREIGRVGNGGGSNARRATDTLADTLKITKLVNESATSSKNY